MPRGKSPGTEKLSAKLLQACGDKLYCTLAKRFTVYISECKVPAVWKESSAVLLFKKEEKGDLENYQLRTLLLEYHEPLVLTFVDYKKAFDSVEPAKVWEALEEQGVETRYTKIQQEC
ncbi:unnamed protein product [Nippostrongylus brasiliensis]|uniref:Reverse transcriptase domain-containing protein n=1 Tax=Nippostrongylus brasiliensis TaxID=27835 RepID=A0A0N4Y565_NIPBR|nr:unnamed protein product [Nippostrongylus brasiliensis]